MYPSPELGLNFLIEMGARTGLTKEAGWEWLPLVALPLLVQLGTSIYYGQKGARELVEMAPEMIEKAAPQLLDKYGPQLLDKYMESHGDKLAEYLVGYLQRNPQVIQKIAPAIMQQMAPQMAMGSLAGPASQAFQALVPALGLMTAGPAGAMFSAALMSPATRDAIRTNLGGAGQANYRPPQLSDARQAQTAQPTQTDQGFQTRQPTAPPVQGGTSSQTPRTAPVPGQGGGIRV